MKKKKIIKTITCIASIISIICIITINTFALPLTSGYSYNGTDNEIARVGRYTNGTVITVISQGYSYIANVGYIPNEDNDRYDKVSIETSLTNAQYDRITSNGGINTIGQYMSGVSSSGATTTNNTNQFIYFYNKYGIDVNPQKSLTSASNMMINGLMIEYNDIYIKDNDFKYTSDDTIAVTSTLPYIQFKYPTSFSKTILTNWLNTHLSIYYTYEVFETTIDTNESTIKDGRVTTTTIQDSYNYNIKSETPLMSTEDSYRLETFTTNGERYARIYFIPRNFMEIENVKGDYGNRASMIKFNRIFVELRGGSLNEPVPVALQEAFVYDGITIGDDYITQTQYKNLDNNYRNLYKLDNGIEKITTNREEIITETIDVGDSFVSWIVNAVSGFLEFEIAPGIELGSILIIIVVFAIFGIIIRIFAGG